MLLADLGAKVIKIERPGSGDGTRNTGRIRNGESYAFAAVNRNKYSVAIDLGEEAGRNLARELCRNADVLVENFRSGVMQRLGLNYESLSQINPKLIYCSISGFGASGPYKDRGGFDLIAQGMSGLVSVTGYPGGPITKIGVPIADLVAGLYGALGVVAALHGANGKRKGQFLDISLLDAAISLMVWESVELWSEGVIPEGKGSAHRNRAPYQAVRAKDGYFMLGAGNEESWKALCAALERPDLSENPLFLTNAQRMSNLDTLIAALEQEFSRESSEHWITVLNDKGCPAGPIYSLKEAYEDPQVQSRYMVNEYEHPALGRTNFIGFPLKFSRHPARLWKSSPALGEDTEMVLRAEIGLSEEEVRTLEADGIIGCS